MLRLVVTRGGRRHRDARDAAGAPETIALQTVTYTPTRVLDGVKSLSYAANMLADAPRPRAGRRRGAARHAARPRPGGPDDVVLLRPRRRGCCTPPLSDRILDSITRRRSSPSPTPRSGSRRSTTSRRRARRSWRRRCARCTRSTRSTARALPAAPGPVSTAAAAAVSRAHRGRARARASRVKIVTVIGNRPQFVKAAAVSRPAARRARGAARAHRPALRRRARRRSSCASSACRRPELELRLGGGTNTEQTARMLGALGDAAAPTSAPDAVLVYGDTNSTLAGGAGRGAGADPRRPRRGRHALLRPRDARGAQPRPHRPRLRPAARARRRRAVDNLAREGGRRARARSSAT